MILFFNVSFSNFQIIKFSNYLMDFEEFFKKKKIDLAALEKADGSLFSEFKTHFEQMGEKSFDHTKKYWFNKLRLLYHLAPEVKEEKVIIENTLAEQTITDTLSEITTPPANAGFKPRFKAGMTKTAEANDETPAEEKSAEPAIPPPAKVGFTPRFKAGLTKPAGAAEPQEEPKTQPTPAPAPPKPGFTPRFKAGVTKPAVESSDIKNPPADESATATPEVNEAAETKDQKPSFEEEKAAMQDKADAMERTADQETPDEDPTQNPSAGKAAYKPRFNMKNIKPKRDE
jgi:hypothetical protein